MATFEDRADEIATGVMASYGLSSDKARQATADAAQIGLEEGYRRGASVRRLTEDELREKIKVAIGYAPVPLSIRDHPEIRSEYRTVEDRDGLIDRISVALKPFVAFPEGPLDPMPWVVHSADDGDIRFATEAACWAGYRANFEPEPQYNQNREAYP